MNVAKTGLVLGCVLVLLSACAPDFEPDADYKGGFLWESEKSRTVVVQPGDTLYTISRRYDVPVKAIISRNALRPPYTLTQGQELIMDPARTYTVEKGDFLSKIAKQQGVELSLIAQANDIKPPYTIYPGQQLWIPDPFTVAAATEVPSSASSAGSREAIAPGAVPAGYTTAAGTPTGRSSAINVETLAPPPGQAAPTEAVVSASPTAPMIANAPAVAPPAPEMPGVTAPPTALTPTTTAVPAAPAIAASAAPAESQVAALPPQAPPAGVSMPQEVHLQWPLKGRLVMGFGPAGKGLHNDGINIGAPQGAQVRAAEGGVVAYAGSELKGFGNLLLIRHADGITTAYAHNDKLLVARGDEVKKGQLIATVGKTGNVDTPQLHFEVRVGTQAVDPMGYLPQATATH
jgi:murein DD-endopeptidase MepM/ murein hydrolase activator NlpD